MRDHNWIVPPTTHLIVVTSGVTSHTQQQHSVFESVIRIGKLNLLLWLFHLPALTHIQIHSHHYTQFCLTLISSDYYHRKWVRAKRRFLNQFLKCNGDAIKFASGFSWSLLASLLTSLLLPAFQLNVVDF